jgi:hypothetical protein
MRKEVFTDLNDLAQYLYRAGYVSLYSADNPPSHIEVICRGQKGVAAQYFNRFNFVRERDAEVLYLGSRIDIAWFKQHVELMPPLWLDEVNNVVYGYFAEIRGGTAS